MLYDKALHDDQLAVKGVARARFHSKIEATTSFLGCWRQVLAHITNFNLSG